MKHNLKYSFSALVILFLWGFIVGFVYLKNELENPAFTSNAWLLLNRILPKEKSAFIDANDDDLDPLYFVKEVSSSSNGIIEEKKITWFAQITDTHISRWGNGLGGENLHRFLNHVLPGLKPLFVTLTGDITDAKGQHYYSALNQNTEEWEQYQILLSEAEVSTNSFFWFDIPGNHDKYGFIDETEHFLGHFEEFGAMSTTNYGQVFCLPWNDSISLVALDATTPIPLPGPIAFYGLLKEASVMRYKKQCEEISQSYPNTTLITISHYPTSCVQVERGRTFLETLSTHSSVYLSGHLHKLLFGLGDYMYLRRAAPNGQPFIGDSPTSTTTNEPLFALDLECGDMKDHGSFRIISTDNNVLSVSEQDITLNMWIHILFPLNGKIGNIKEEDFDEIRVLIFTPGHPSFASKIVEAKVWIDGGLFHSTLINLPGTPLWSTKLPDSIRNIPKGKHTIIVKAKDDSSLSSTRKEDFYIAETETSLLRLTAFSSVMSMWSWDLIIYALYWPFYLICAVILLYFILCPPKCLHPAIVFAIFVFHLYTSVGPILISYNHPSFTLVFLWGVWRERWVKILDSWVFAGVGVLGFHYIPSYVCIFMAAPYSAKKTSVGVVEMICISIITLHLAFLILTMTSNYGLLYLLLSPGVGIHFLFFSTLYFYLKFFRMRDYHHLKKD